MSYRDKLLKIATSGLKGRRVVAVYHDNNCPKLQTGGECTCEAELEVSEPITSANIDEQAKRINRQQKWGRNWRMS